MSSDINVQTFSGKVNITSNLLVGSSHLFVDTINNRVGLVTNTPDAGLHVNSNAYVHTNFRVGSGIVMNDTTGRITAGSFVGDGSAMTGINSDSGSWVNGTDVVHLATTGDKVGIGTASPATNLNIQGDSGGVPPTTGGEGTSNGIFRVRDNYNVALDIGTKGSSPWTTWLQVADATSMGTEYPLSLQPNGGNVGIGTDDPKQPLEVKTDAVVSGRLGVGTVLTSAQNAGGQDIWNLGTAARLVVRCLNNADTTASYANAKAYAGIALVPGFDASDTTNIGLWGSGSGENPKFYIQNMINNGANGGGYVLLQPVAGNVGIGTTSPGAKLDVNGGVILTGGVHGSRPTNDGGVLANAEIRGGPGVGSAGFLRLAAGGYNNGSASDATSKSFIDLCGYSGTSDFDRNISFHTLNQERMRINLSGNVGIGTTSPQRTLDVSTTGSIGLGNNIGAANERGLYWSNDSDYAIYRTSEAWSSPNYAQLKLKWSTGIVLQTARGTYGKSFVGVDDRMSIGASYHTTKSPTNGLIVEGNVGIGTTDPQGALHVAGNSGPSNTSKALGIHMGVHASNYAHMEIVCSGSYSGWIDFKNATTSGNGDYEERIRGGDGNLVFHTNKGERMRINASGNVGIGTSSPTAKLHVDAGTGVATRITGATQWTNRPFAMMGRTAGRTYAPNVVVCNVTGYNSGIANTSNGRFTAPTGFSGYYFVTFSGLAGAGETSPNDRWYKNGADTGWGSSHVNSSSLTPSRWGMSSQCIIYLNAGDYLEHRVIGGSLYGSSQIHSTHTVMYLHS